MAKEEVIKAVSKIKTLPAPSPTAALDAFNMLVSAYKEYKVTVEVESSKREAISSWRDTQLTKLGNQKELLHQYLEGQFKERRHAIDEMFKRLDAGIESGNMEIVNMAMNSIVGIVQTSPLREAEKIIQAMNDPNVQKIEF